MPFRLSTVAAEGYLLLEHHGDVSTDEVRDAREAVLGELARSNPGRVLVDCREASAIPQAADFYYLLVHEATVTPNLRSKVALLAAESSESVVKFVENVAHNRGLHVKAFTSRDGALKWLFDDDTSL
jgi:hypothetical protein